MNDQAEPGYPRVLAIAWGMYQAPHRGPKRELSHEGIVDAAIELADAGGLGAVTMQKVAEALGFTTMSLYRYVANKDELILLMQDRAAELPAALPIDADDWQVGLREVVQLMTANFRVHPWLVDVPMSATSVVMPNNLRYTDGVLRALRTLPVAPADKSVVLLLLALLTRAYAAMERDLRSARSPAEADFTPGLLQLLAEVVTDARYPDLAPALRTGEFFQADAPGTSADDFSADLRFALDRLVDGLADYAAAHPVSSAPPAALDAAAEAARAEVEYAAAVALRKAAEQRVKELGRRESAAQRVRDRARERAKRA